MVKCCVQSCIGGVEINGLVNTENTDSNILNDEFKHDDNKIKESSQSVEPDWVLCTWKSVKENWFKVIHSRLPSASHGFNILSKEKEQRNEKSEVIASRASLYISIWISVVCCGY